MDRDIAVVVHGGDFAALGCRKDLEWCAEGLSLSFELNIKTRVGDGEDCCKDVRVLNRIVPMDSEGLYYESDPRHVESIARDLGIHTASGVEAPGDHNAPADHDTVLDEAVGCDINNDELEEDNAHVSSLTKRKTPRLPSLHATFDENMLITYGGMNSRAIFLGKLHSMMYPYHHRMG